MSVFDPWSITHHYITQHAPVALLEVHPVQAHRLDLLHRVPHPEARRVDNHVHWVFPPLPVHNHAPAAPRRLVASLLPLVLRLLLG